MMRAVLLMLVACAPIAPREPNTGSLCDRAIECGTFVAEQRDACTACLEHWADQLNDDIKANVPPPHDITCELLDYIAQNKRIAECVEEGWWE